MNIQPEKQTTIVTPREWGINKRVVIPGLTRNPWYKWMDSCFRRNDGKESGKW